MRRLNFGCGSIQPPSWTNVDHTLHPPGENFVLGDVLTGLPFSDGYFDYAVANHSLQQLGHPDDIVKGLVELRRVLKDRGVLRIMVPDILGAFYAFGRREREWFPNRANHVTLDEVLCTYLTWYGTNITAFTAEYLLELLARAGFGAVGECSAGLTVWGDPFMRGIFDLDDREHESIYVEGMK